ncbi:tetratricopeptide repeat protein, partial [Patescibacteria group bacterium]|nr:tetratricopeptide repeat protein [Patescibacteria group bacterium]
RISFLKIDNRIVLLLNKLREKQTEPEVEKDGQIDNAEKKIEEKEKDKFLQKERSVVENELQDSKVSEDIAGGKAAEIASEDGREEITSSISEKENAKGKEKEYIKIILKNPIDIKAYWNLGVVYSRRRNYKDAISCFRQITKIDPTYFKAKKKISDLMERMKRKDKDEDRDSDKNKFESENIDAQKKEENDAQLTDNNEK